MIRRLAAVLATLLAGATPAFAANTQVDPSEFKAAGKTGYVYGRSDGVFQEATTKAPYAIENGQPGQPIGVGYRETFAYGDNDGLSQLDQSGLLTCVGNTTTVPCLATFGSGVRLMWAPVVTATALLDMDATSLDIAGDQTDDDGIEIFGGVGGASGRPFIIGEDPAFYFCATLDVEDVSGADEVRIGFRKVEAMNATWGSYDEYASIGPNSGNITITTELAGAGETDTDTTDDAGDSDAGKKYCVNVSGAGVVTYTVNVAAPTATAAFTFTDGIAVIPVIHFLHASDLAGEIDLTLWEVGYTPSN